MEMTYIGTTLHGIKCNGPIGETNDYCIFVFQICALRNGQVTPIASINQILPLGKHID